MRSQLFWIYFVLAAIVAVTLLVIGIHNVAHSTPTHYLVHPRRGILM